MHIPLKTPMTTTNKILRHRSQKTRHPMTQFKRQVAEILKYLLIPTQKQVVIGHYIADFIGKDRNFVLEVDGPIRNDHQPYDALRDAFFREAGFKVVRIRHEDVSPDAISQALQEAPLVGKGKMRDLVWYAGIVENFWFRKWHGNTVGQTRPSLRPLATKGTLPGNS